MYLRHIFQIRNSNKIQDMFKKKVKNLTCPNCKFLFPLGCNNGVLACHLKYCKSPSKILMLRPPNISSNLVDIYHGNVSEMPGDEPEYQDGPEPLEFTYLLNSAVDGEQEANFEEVVIQMEKGYEIPEESYINTDICSSEMKVYQQQLWKRYMHSNPLHFRGVTSYTELECLEKIFLYVRAYDLSVSAGVLNVYIS
jgi:hypothetical protein